MVRGRAQGHPLRRTLCPHKMHIAPTLTSGFGSIRPIVPGTDLAGESTARGKVRSQLIVGGEEVFGLDAGLPDDRHEIGISRPAG